MGHSSSATEAAGKFTRLAGELREIPNEAVGAAALHVKRSVLAVAPARLRGVGKRGAKLGVTYRVRNAVATGEAYALVRAQGPWQLVEHRTSPHTIPKQGRSKRRRVAVVPGYGPRSRIEHPGTKPSRPWAKGVAAATPTVKAEFRATLPTALRKVF